MIRPALVLTLATALALAACGKQPPAAPAAPAGTAPGAATQGAAPHPMMPGGEAHPMPVAPAADVDLTGIAKADGGQTIAEIYAGKDGLAGQPVVFRGKVVKTNANIMGKNWLHVRDGSGSDGTNDLTVTTAGTLPNVGDTVVVAGPVVLNRDFGMGYQYDVIIEDAQVTVETPGT